MLNAFLQERYGFGVEDLEQYGAVCRQRGNKGYIYVKCHTDGVIAYDIDTGEIAGSRGKEGFSILKKPETPENVVLVDTVCNAVALEKLWGEKHVPQNAFWIALNRYQFIPFFWQWLKEIKENFAVSNPVLYIALDSNAEKKRRIVRRAAEMIGYKVSLYWSYYMGRPVHAWQKYSQFVQDNTRKSTET